MADIILLSELNTGSDIQVLADIVDRVASTIVSWTYWKVWLSSIDNYIVQEYTGSLTQIIEVETDSLIVAGDSITIRV